MSSRPFNWRVFQQNRPNADIGVLPGLIGIERWTVSPGPLSLIYKSDDFAQLILEAAE
jgi:hypothetical protein